MAWQKLQRLMQHAEGELACEMHSDKTARCCRYPRRVPIVTWGSGSFVVVCQNQVFDQDARVGCDGSLSFHGFHSCFNGNWTIRWRRCRTRVPIGKEGKFRVCTGSEASQASVVQAGCITQADDQTLVRAQDLLQFSVLDDLRQP